MGIYRVFSTTTLLYHSCKFCKCGKKLLTLRGTRDAMIIFVGKKGRDRRSCNMTEIARENTRMAGLSDEKLCLLRYRWTATFRQIVPMLH